VATDEKHLVWNLRHTLAPGQVASAGLEHSSARISSDTVYNRSTRSQTTARAGLDGAAGAWQWQAHLRHDDTSDFGNATTGRAGLAWLPAPGWRVGVSLASGFNAPSFNDLFYPFGGNPALKPERARSAELQLGWAGGGQAVRATLFSQRLRDLIGNDSNFNRVNINRARNQGLELQATLKAAGLTLTPYLTMQEPVDLATGAQLPRRAKVLAGTQLAGQAGPVSWQAGLRLVDDRWDNVANTRLLPAYTLLDLGGQWALTPAWSVAAQLRNATDKAYEDAWGYRSPGRTLALTLQYALR
jgi:vitamin B12 transporter